MGSAESDAQLLVSLLHQGTSRRHPPIRKNTSPASGAEVSQRQITGKFHEVQHEWGNGLAGCSGEGIYGI